MPVRGIYDKEEKKLLDEVKKLKGKKTKAALGARRPPCQFLTHGMRPPDPASVVHNHPSANYRAPLKNCSKCLTAAPSVESAGRVVAARAANACTMVSLRWVSGEWCVASRSIGT